MGWGCQAKKWSLKSLFSAHVKQSNKILLLTAKSFLFWCCYLHWKVKWGCQVKCEKLTTSRAHVVLFWPLGQYGSVTWGQDDLSDCNYMTSNSVDLLRSFLPYIKCIYQISKTNGQWQWNLNEFVKWRKKTFLVCARHCHHNNNRIRMHTNTQIQVKTVLSINNRQWANGTLVTSDTLNRLPAVDGLRCFHSLSSRHRQTCRHTRGHTHTVSAKHLLFLTPAGCEREHSRRENTKEQALTWERD